MTALAGSIPRMMRPTLAQNYPRSGFPLEGKASHWKRRVTGLEVDGRFGFHCYIIKSHCFFYAATDLWSSLVPNLGLETQTLCGYRS